MTRLMVIYDPNDRITGFTPDQLKHLGAKEAAISLPDEPTVEQIKETMSKLMMLLSDQL